MADRPSASDADGDAPPAIDPLAKAVDWLQDLLVHERSLHERRSAANGGKSAPEEDEPEQQSLNGKNRKRAKVKPPSTARVKSAPENPGVRRNTPSAKERVRRYTPILVV